MKSGFIIAGIVGIVAIVLFFLASIDAPQPRTTVEYNGYTFVQNGSFWTTRLRVNDQLYDIDFRYHPQEVVNIPVEGTLGDHFQDEVVYLTIDPTDERTAENSYLALGAVEVASKLTTPFDRIVVPACTVNETQSCVGRPIVTCDSNVSVVYMKLANDTRIILDDNCVTIQGSGENFVKAAELAVFRWLGIA